MKINDIKNRKDVDKFVDSIQPLAVDAGLCKKHPWYLSDDSCEDCRGKNIDNDKWQKVWADVVISQGKCPKVVDGRYCNLKIYKNDLCKKHNQTAKIVQK